MWKGLLLGWLLLAITSNRVSASGNYVYCYFGSWSTYRYGNGHFDVEDIDPNLCTHAAFGFAGLDTNSFEIKALDPYNELEENWGRGAFKRFTDMKQRNPNLKTFISVGGWNEGNFQKMMMPENCIQVK